MEKAVFIQVNDRNAGKISMVLIYNLNLPYKAR